MEEYKQDSIGTLSSRDAVRKRPALYFKECFEEKSLDKLPLEVLCHALDEYLDGKCNQIAVTVFPDAFKIVYDAGMPLEADRDGITKAELIMTAMFACRNHKKYLSVGEEFCELGMATINYVTSACELITIYKEQKGHFIFKEGLLKEKSVIASPGTADTTMILMQPDRTLFGEAMLSYEGVKKRIDIIKDKLPGLEVILTSNTIQ